MELVHKYKRTNLHRRMSACTDVLVLNMVYKWPFVHLYYSVTELPPGLRFGDLDLGAPLAAIGSNCDLTCRAKL
jgi:hypothetical protein